MEHSTDSTVRTDASDGPGAAGTPDPAAAPDPATSDLGTPDPPATLDPTATPDSAGTPDPMAAPVPPAAVTPEPPERPQPPYASWTPADLPGAGTAPPPATRQRFTLRRSRSDRMLGGVCGGLAKSLDVDAALLRIGLVALTLLGFGLGALIYLAVWILAPVDETEA